jgi:DHA1 family purine base/nucleoside efflux pump-like MFS transporter
MNFRVYLLALAAFVVGIDENIIGGILPSIAHDLSVSISMAGQLTSIFSLTFALCAPILLSFTTRFERRNLLLWALAVFALGNFASALATNYTALFLFRIVSAASCSLIVVLCTTCAAALVEPNYRGRAIGIIFMGISGSLVLGVPFGIFLSDQLSWRVPFIIMTLLILIMLILLKVLLPQITTQQLLPLRNYWLLLKKPSLVSAQLVSILMIAGHFTLFAYLAPYLGMILELYGNNLSLTYGVFGISAVFGGYLGGFLSDRLGARRTLWLVPALFTLTLAVLPLSTASPWSFFPVMMIWSCLSWSISPTVQNYLIRLAPADSEGSIGLNTSAMHMGVALGSACGGVIITWQSLLLTPWVGAKLSALAILCALFSLYFSRLRSKNVTEDY